MQRLASFLVRLYPATWRMRYEEEVRALLEDRPPRVVDLFGLARGVVTERFATVIDPVEHPWASAVLTATLGWFGIVLLIQVFGVVAGRQLATTFGPAPASLQYFAMVAMLGLVGRTMTTGAAWLPIPTIRRPLSAREVRVWWVVLQMSVVAGHWTNHAVVAAWQVWMFLPLALLGSTEAAWLRARARADWMKAREEHRDGVQGYQFVANLVAQGRATPRELSDLGRDVARLSDRARDALAAYRATGARRLPPRRPLGLS